MRWLTRKSVTQLQCWTCAGPMSQYAMHKTRGAVMPFVRGHPPGVFHRLHLTEQIGGDVSV